MQNESLYLDATDKFDQTENYQESLLNLVNPELNVLVGCWLAALRDSALLFLPVEFKSQLPENGGTFYTNDSSEVNFLFVNCKKNLHAK